MIKKRTQIFTINLLKSEMRTRSYRLSVRSIILKYWLQMSKLFRNSKLSAKRALNYRFHPTELTRIALALSQMIRADITIHNSNLLIIINSLDIIPKCGEDPNAAEVPASRRVGPPLLFGHQPMPLGRRTTI